MLRHLPTERYQVVGRVVHMDFIQEHLRTKKNVNFQDNQKRPNNIELEVLADTVYVKVTNVPELSKHKQTFIIIVVIFSF